MSKGGARNGIWLAFAVGLAASACGSSAPADAGPQTDGGAPADGSASDGSPGPDAGCPVDRCEGVCTDTRSDVLHCGSCTNACVPDDHGTLACVGGECEVTCEPGYVDVGGTCTGLPAPRPIAPLSTATSTSWRPSFHWELAAGTDGARLEICADRGCGTVLATVDATGTTATPLEDLAPGVVYWRLYGRSGADVGPTASVTWELFVGARSAPLDTSWGSVLDVDGDGDAEVAISAPNATAGAGRVYVYAGGSSGLGSVPVTTLTGPDGADGHFGYSVASAGDIDGDGFVDLIVGAYSVASYEGRACVYLGGASGLATAPAAVLVGPDGADGRFGISVAGAGDVNRDGYADVIIGASDASTRAGRAYVYHGSATGLSATAAVTLSGSTFADGYFGSSVAGVGDVDADGYADVLVGAYGEISNIGRAYFYFGSAAGLPTTPSQALAGLQGVGGRYGAAVSPAGDIDADGYADFLIGANGVASYVGSAYLYRGGPRPLSVAPTTLDGRNGVNAHFGRALASAGDVDGDGYADIIIGASDVNLSEGRAYLYSGGATGIDLVPGGRWVGPSGAGGRFGVALAGLGDVDGDGYSDLVIGSPGATSLAGLAHLYLGGASGSSAVADLTLSAPDGGYFGGAIAGLR